MATRNITRTFMIMCEEIKSGLGLPTRFTFAKLRDTLRTAFQRATIPKDSVGLRLFVCGELEPADGDDGTVKRFDVRWLADEDTFLEELRKFTDTRRAPCRVRATTRRAGALGTRAHPHCGKGPGHSMCGPFTGYANSTLTRASYS